MLNTAIYTSTQEFHGEFYYYTANGPSGNKGYITLVPSATAEKCPAGRKLYATGKKLVPGIHPMAFLLGQPNPNPKPLVSVYDSTTFIRGYIDPTSPTFSRIDMPQVSTDGEATQPPVAAPVDAPVATSVDTSVSAPVAAPVLAPVAAPLPPPEPVIPTKLCISSRVVFPAGDYSTTPAEAGISSLGTITNIAGKLTMKVNTDALTEDSMIFLTPLGRGPTLVAISDVQVSTGQFTIAAGSVCTVNWMIVN